MFRLLLTGILLSAGVPLNAQEGGRFELGSKEFLPVHDTAHNTYSYALTAVSKKGGRLRSLDLLFGFQDASNTYHLTLTSRSARLEVLESGERRTLARSSGRFLGGGEKQIEIRRRKRWIYAVVNGALAIRALDSSFHDGKLCIGLQDDLDITSLRCQPSGDITFSEGFMKTEEEAKDLGEWNPASGEWKIFSVADRVRESGMALKKGREPQAERSSNPFSMSSVSTDESLIVTGSSFWDDYRAEVSAKTTGGQFGLVFGYSENRHYLLRWKLALPLPHGGKVELIKVEGDKEKLLGKKSVRGRTGNWYRLQASIVAGRIRASIDDTPLFSVYDDECVGGKIGLFSKGAQRTVYDDVSVRSVEAVDFDTPEMLATHGEAVSGKWRPVEQESGLELELNKESGTYAFGDPKWQGYRFSAEGFLSSAANEIGIIAGLRDGSQLLCLLSPSDAGSRRLEVIQESAGDRKTIARFPSKAKNDRWIRFDLDLTESGLLQFYLDGRLVVRQPMDTSAVSGRPAVYGRGESIFRNISVFGQERADWSRSTSTDIFIDDPYMQGWASPKWDWVPVGRPEKESQPETYIHKGSFFGRFKIEAPLTGDSTWFFGTDTEMPGDGYEIAFKLDKNKKRCSVSLKRKGEEVDKGSASVKLSVPNPDDAKLELNWGTFGIQRDGRYILPLVGGKELFVFGEREEAPLKGTTLGLIAPLSTDLGKIKVSRDHVKDYLFEKAASDWERIGEWAVTNRFSCDPRWSHLNGRSFGLAALWNKHEFEGDFTIEFYAGMRMRQGEMRLGPIGWFSYPRVGDINLAFCGDGQDVFSGYTLVLSEWDRDWSEKTTRLYRRREFVQTVEKELIPSVRSERPQFRPIELEWDPGGRPVHGAWYYVKLKRRGPKIEVFFDNRIVMSWEDPSPLDGKHIAIWTQSNSIMVARAKISYAQASLRKATLVEVDELEVEVADMDAEATFDIHTSTHPIVLNDFDDHLGGWLPARKDQSAFLSLDSRIKVHGRRSLKLLNMNPGGDFGVSIPLEAFDLSKVTELSFDYRIPENVKVNLYLNLEDEPYNSYFVRLTGESAHNVDLFRLGGFKAVADGEWHRAVLPLGRMLRAARPRKKQFIVSEMRIGNFHEGYLNAGYGGNHAGAVYHLDNFKLLTAGPPKATFTFSSDKEIKEFHWLVDRKKTTSPIRSATAKVELAIVPVDDLALAPIKSSLSKGKQTVAAKEALEKKLAIKKTITRTKAAPKTEADAIAMKLRKKRNLFKKNWRDKVREKLAGRPKKERRKAAKLLKEKAAAEKGGLRTEKLAAAENWRAEKIARKKAKFEAVRKKQAAEDAQKRAEAQRMAWYGIYKKPKLQSVEPKVTASAHIDDLEPGTWYLHVAGKTAAGRWTKSRHQKFRVDPLTSVTAQLPEAGDSWGGEPITLQFDRQTTSAPVISSIALAIDGQAAALNEESLDYDPDARTLKIGLNQSGLIFEDGLKLSFKLDFEDASRLPLPAEKKNKPASKSTPKVQHPGPKTISHQWEYTVKASADHTPPTRVTIAERVLDEDFEETAGSVTNYSAPYGAFHERIAAGGRDGSTCLKITNRMLGGYGGALLTSRSFNYGRFPLLALDYKTDGRHQSDFHTTFGGGGRYIGFTDLDNKVTLTGTVEGIQADGEWHHAEIDMKKIVDSAMSTFQPALYQAKGLTLADFGHRGNLAGVTIQLDNLSLVPVFSSRNGLTLSWSARDITGIKSYACKWSEKPDDNPGTKATTSESSATFNRLKEGEQFFHIRAQDKAGNWGAVSHYRFRIDNTAPRAARHEPANQSRAVSPFVEIHLDDPGSGLDPESLALRMNGKAVSLSPTYTSLKPDRGILRYDWAPAMAPMTEPIPNGTRMEFELAPVKDLAGNSAGPMKWVWTVDHSKDKDGPAPPSVTSFSDGIAIFDSFDSGTGSWGSKGSKGAVLSNKFDEERKNNCLRIVTTNKPEKTLVYTSKKIALNTQPLVTFEYKFPPGINLMFRIDISGTTYVLDLTRGSDRYDSLGQVPGIVADGKWHRATFNVLDMVKKALPEDVEITSSHYYIGNWSKYVNPPGVEFFLDNFCITGTGSPAPYFTWSSYDATGISGHSLLLDKNPESQPPGRISIMTNDRHFPVLNNPGLWFMHLRARDGAGNWGRAMHYPYYCTEIPPAVVRDGLEAQTGWKAEPASANCKVSLAQVKSNRGRALLSVAMRSAKVKGQPSPAFTVLRSAGQLLMGKKKLIFNLYHNNSRPLQPYLIIRTKEGIEFYHAKPPAASTRTWSNDLSYDLTPSIFRTRQRDKTGRYPQLDFKDAESIGLKFNCYYGNVVFLIDDIRVE